MSGGSVAELTVVVPSPAPECVVGFGGARMDSSGANGFNKIQLQLGCY